MDLVIISIGAQCLGLGCLYWAIDCFRGSNKKFKLAANILYGIFLLIAGFFLIFIFGYDLIFVESVTGYNLPIWTIPISILITSYLYFYLPKTKFWKNRGKAKQPLEDATNSMFRFIGQVMMFAGAGHILFAIYVWLKKGIWTTISLGDWGITIFKLNDLGRIDTGWWAINKVLNYIILDLSVAIPLIAIGFIIYINAKGDWGITMND